MRSALLLGLLLAVGFVLFRLTMRGGETVPAADAVAAIRGGAAVVDVRTAGEFAGGHVAGARHADLLGGDFRERVDALDRSEPVYVYCASGLRSGRAARVLEGMGFERVVNAGGLGELAAAGAPVER